MSTETGPDRPSQRTVAELLAEYGGGQPRSGRRRARDDDDDLGGQPPGSPGADAPPAGTALQHEARHRGGPHAVPGSPPASWRVPPPAPEQQPYRPGRRELREAWEADPGYSAPPLDPPAPNGTGIAGRPPGRPFADNPTDQIPRLGDSNGNGRPPAPPRRGARDAGPSTSAISPAELLADDADQDDERGVTDLEPAATSDADGADTDSEAGKPRAGRRLGRRSERRATRGGLRSRRKAKPGKDGTVGNLDEDDKDDDQADLPTAVTALAGASEAAATTHAAPAGLHDTATVQPAEAPGTPRAGRSTSRTRSPATAWLMMVLQVIGGVIGGAALWVAFRYLWQELPPVALGAAVLITAGSVVLVRALRRSDDLRTSMFALLVGLIVTVSPAVLVLVNR